jgi:hypothetical protein
MIRRRISFGSLVRSEFERCLMEELLRVISEEVYFRWRGGRGFGFRFRFQGRVGGCGMTAGRSGYGTFWRWVIYAVIFSSFCFDFLDVICYEIVVLLFVVKDLLVRNERRNFKF